MVINHLLNGMVLQVRGFPLALPFGEAQRSQIAAKLQVSLTGALPLGLPRGDEKQQGEAGKDVVYTLED